MNAETPAAPALAPSAFDPALVAGLHDRPRLFKGLAAHWPALTAWRFARLAAMAPRREVALVDGNREHGRTRFARADLRAYLRALGRPDARLPYLKEFDLLAAMPLLRDDHRLDALLPGSHLRSVRTWIGPAGASTGLHHDLLDNLAVQIVGRKRFRLLPPGSVERLAGVSAKYDPWAVLARGSAQVFAAQLRADERGYEVELEAGDVLHLPARWWHEVSNPQPGVLLSAFHGPRLPVWGQWLRVQVRGGLHRCGLVGRHGCTCHAAATAAGEAQADASGRTSASRSA
ncbi:MAG: cupin-like domain-containing protein [Burkholderiaceae bacterium]